VCRLWHLRSPLPQGNWLVLNVSKCAIRPPRKRKVCPGRQRARPLDWTRVTRICVAGCALASHLYRGVHSLCTPLCTHPNVHPQHPNAHPNAHPYAHPQLNMKYAQIVWWKWQWLAREWHEGLKRGKTHIKTHELERSVPSDGLGWKKINQRTFTPTQQLPGGSAP